MVALDLALGHRTMRRPAGMPDLLAFRHVVQLASQIARPVVLEHPGGDDEPGRAWHSPRHRPPAGGHLASTSRPPLDRGVPMTTKSLALLTADFGVSVSRARPRTSNDNLLSEAQIKTAKNHTCCPDWFNSLVDTRGCARHFFPWYNIERSHIGLGLMTSVAVHLGRVPACARGANASWAW